MMTRISKTLVAGLASLAMAAAVVLPAAPASAQSWHGGWHGGGWHGGGWAGRGFWHPGYWRGGVWYNGWWAPAVAAGVVAGAAIASAPYWGGYGYGGYGGGGCWQYRTTYDAAGNPLGQSWVNLC
jgi:hypothetical protein